MFDFGPRRQEQECVEKTTSCKKKTRRGRPEKKPDYCKEKMIGDLIAKAVELFREPYDDRDVRAKDAPKIIEVAEAMNITQIKVRKMLITAEYYSSDLSRQVQKLHEQGYTIPQIMEKTGLKRAAVYSYLPYSKGAYNLCSLSIGAENSSAYRERKRVCDELDKHLDCEQAFNYFWDAIVTFENYLFRDEQGNGIKYTITDEEIHCNGQVITKAELKKAFRSARETERTEGCVSEAGKLGCKGACELYAVFLRIGACKNNPKN